MFSTYKVALSRSQQTLSFNRRARLTEPLLFTRPPGAWRTSVDPKLLPVLRGNSAESRCPVNYFIVPKVSGGTAEAEAMDSEECERKCFKKIKCLA